jgi:hypothetical protein
MRQLDPMIWAALICIALLFVLFAVYWFGGTPLPLE